MKAYLESINNAQEVGTLQGLNYDGNYTVIIINAYQGADYMANVTIVIEDTLTYIPECPSLIIPPLFMMATLLAVAIYRRKRLQT